eukprot:gene3386-4262_t
MQSKLLLLFSLLAKFRFGYSRCVHEEVQDQLPNSFTFVQYASHPYGHGFHKPTTEGEEDDIGEYSVSRKLAAEGENAFEGVYKSLRMQVEARYSSDVPPETQAWISDYLLPAAQHWWESALQVIRVDDALGFPQELLTDCFDIEPPVAASFADVDYVLLMGVFEIAGTAYGISESTVKVSTERGHEHCDPETNPATCVYHLVTPAVRDAARRHFGCDDLAGAELENQPTSAGRLLGSHWEMRLFNGEVMNPAFFVTPFISEVTLAFFEDSGWYQCDPVERQDGPGSDAWLPAVSASGLLGGAPGGVTIWVGSSDNLQQSVRCGRLDKDQPMEVPGYAGQLLCPDVDALCGTAGYCDAKLSELTEMTVITAIALTVALAVYAAHRLYMRATCATRAEMETEMEPPLRRSQCRHIALAAAAEELSHRLVVAPLYALAALRCLPWHLHPLGAALASCWYQLAHSYAMPWLCQPDVAHLRRDDVVSGCGFATEKCLEAVTELGKLPASQGTPPHFCNEDGQVGCTYDYKAVGKCAMSTMPLGVEGKPLYPEYAYFAGTETPLAAGAVSTADFCPFMVGLAGGACYAAQCDPVERQ